MFTVRATEEAEIYSAGRMQSSSMLRQAVYIVTTRISRVKALNTTQDPFY
jgi:hypothetical protein